MRPLLAVDRPSVYERTLICGNEVIVTQQTDAVLAHGRRVPIRFQHRPVGRIPYRDSGSAVRHERDLQRFGGRHFQRDRSTTVLRVDEHGAGQNFGFRSTIANFSK